MIAKLTADDLDRLTRGVIVQCADLEVKKRRDGLWRVWSRGRYKGDSLTSEALAGLGPVGELPECDAPRVKGQPPRKARAFVSTLPPLEGFEVDELELLGPLSELSAGEENVYFTLSDGRAGFVKAEVHELPASIRAQLSA